MKKSDFEEALCLLRRMDLRGLLISPTKNGFLQLGRYVMVGGGAFLVDFGSYCLLGHWGVHYMAAGILSFILGFAFNFLISRLLIFSTAAEKRINIRELVSVLAISLLGLLITEGLLYVGTDMLKMDFRLSKIIASVIVLFWNYFARKIVVYK